MFCSCFATAKVPSGLPSSTIIISKSISLIKGKMIANKMLTNWKCETKFGWKNQIAVLTIQTSI